MRAKVMALALVAAIIALPVPASQLLAGTFSASAQHPAAPKMFGTLIEDPFLADRLSFTPVTRLRDAGL